MAKQLSDKAKKHIDCSLTKFPATKAQSAIMPALSFVQQENGGWLTDELLQQVADYLKVPKITVLEVASFYSMYELAPVGKYKICVCVSLSCQLCSSFDLVKYLQEKLQIGLNQVTADGKFSLKEVECLANCDGAPTIQIADKYYNKVTPAAIDKLLKELT